MNRRLKDIYRLTGRRLLLSLLSLALLATAGCVTEEFPDAAGEDEGIPVTFVISGGMPAQTRADGENPDEEDGTDAESFIDINDLYIFAFEITDGSTVADGNSKLLQTLWSPADTDSQNKSKVWTIDGKTVWLRAFLNPDPNGENKDYYKKEDGTYRNFSIVAVANASEWLESGSVYQAFAKGTKLSQLQRQLKYTNVINAATSSWAPGYGEGDSAIPLFGIKRVNLAGYDAKVHDESFPLNLGTVMMLRTMAKVEITTASTSGLTIASACVIGGGWNTESTLIPFITGNDGSSSLNSMQDYATSGSTGQMVAAPSFESQSSMTGQNLNFTISQDGTAVVYLPEYKLQDNNKDIIRLKFKETGDKEYPLSIAPYSPPTDGIYWQYILRNYLYRYRINAIQADLEISYTVCPMDEVTINIPDYN